MKSIWVEGKVAADGVLRLEIPLGVAEAGRPIRVTATPLPWPISQEEYQRIVKELAGSWGDDVRLAREDESSPAQGSSG